MIAVVSACGRFAFEPGGGEDAAGALDAPLDAPGCPEGYQAVGSSHYRDLDIHPWPEAATLCGAEGTHTLLVDSAQEATDVLAFGPLNAQNGYWLAFSWDGAGFPTDLGTTQTYLPWSPAPPDTSVIGARAVLSNSGTFYLRSDGGSGVRLVCECFE